MGFSNYHEQVVAKPNSSNSLKAREAKKARQRLYISLNVNATATSLSLLCLFTQLEQIEQGDTLYKCNEEIRL